MTPNTQSSEIEAWKEQVRDWWYSIQGLLAEKDICLHERKRVEIETIFKTTLTNLTAQHEARMREMIDEIQNKIFDFSDESFPTPLVKVKDANKVIEAITQRYLTNPDTK